MKRSGKAARMKEDNPICFKESKIGEAGVYLSEGSSISDKSWVVDSRTSFVNYSEIGDNIFYLDSGFIMEENSKFNGSLFSRGGKSNITYTTIRTNIVRRDSQVFIIDSKVELATFRVRPGTLTIRNSTVIGANPPSITTDIGQFNKFLGSGIIVDSLVYLGNDNNLSIGDYIISNSKVNLDVLDGMFHRSRIISDVICLEKKPMQISLPIVNNRSI